MQRCLGRRRSMLIRREKRIWNAVKNRQEIIAAKLRRRDLIKLGLVTSAGYLVVKGGLSARADGFPQSPPTESFVEPLPIPPVKQPVPTLDPVPQVAPNLVPDRRGRIEGRTRSHQALTQFPPQKYYEADQKQSTHSFHRD